MSKILTIKQQVSTITKPDLVEFYLRYTESLHTVSCDALHGGESVDKITHSPVSPNTNKALFPIDCSYKVV